MNEYSQSNLSDGKQLLDILHFCFVQPIELHVDLILHLTDSMEKNLSVESMIFLPFMEYGQKIKTENLDISRRLFARIG